MISLKENKIALINIKDAIKTIDDIDFLIKHYSKPERTVSYVEFYGVDGPGSLKVQFKSVIAVAALKYQRDVLVEYMATLGIEVD